MPGTVAFGRDAAAVRDSQALGEALNALGRVQFLMGSFDASMRTLERAVAVREAHHGPTSTEVRISLNNLATNLARRGRLAEARPYFERLVAAEEAATRTSESTRTAPENTPRRWGPTTVMITTTVPIGPGRAARSPRP